MKKVFSAIFILTLGLQSFAAGYYGFGGGGPQQDRGTRGGGWHHSSDGNTRQNTREDHARPLTGVTGPRQDNDGRSAHDGGDRPQYRPPQQSNFQPKPQQTYFNPRPGSVVYGAPPRPQQRNPLAYNPSGRVVTRTYVAPRPTVWRSSITTFYPSSYYDYGYYGSGYYNSSYYSAPVAPVSDGQNNDGSVMGGYENWGFYRLNADAAQAAGIDGSGVGIMVIDSGVSPHGEFAPKAIQMLDFSGSGPYDLNGHGTGVIGVILSGGAQVRGVAPGATVYSAKFKAGTASSAAQITSAINWALDHNKTAQDKISVINLSYGFGIPQPDLDAAIKKAYAAGITVVAPAGDDTSKQIMFPATMQEVIAVAGSTPLEAAYANTSYGKSVSFVAPGGTIYTTGINNSYVWMDGASLASAYVSGLAALAVQMYRQKSGADPSPARVRQMLSNSAAQLPGIDKTVQGFGMPDANKLVQ